MSNHDNYIQKIKDMKMPPLKKNDIVNHMLYYLNTELWLNMSLPNPTILNAGKVAMLIKSIETLYTIAIRSGIPIKEDHHRAIHRDTEIAEWKKMIEGFQ